MATRGWEDFDPVEHIAAKVKPPKRRKFGNVPTEIDGITFASMREANRYLHLREEAGNRTITELEIQPRFPLHAQTPNGIRVEIGSYVADFRYRRDGATVIEDAKGMRTPLYSWKKKHVECEYGIQIVEV